MVGYCLIEETGRQVDLRKWLSSDEQRLRKIIGFATRTMHEDLHYEQSYEFLVPQGGPLMIKIFAGNYEIDNKGDESLGRFQEVVVRPGQMLVAHPEHCHLVVEKERFVALKVEGKYKILAKERPETPGCCSNGICSLWSLCLRMGTER